jgi:hypothetical protein
VVHIVSFVVEPCHFPSAHDGMLEGFARSLMEIVDLIPSDLPSAIPQCTAPAHESVWSPFRLHLTITIQSVDELLYSRAAIRIDLGNMFSVLFPLGILLAVQEILVYTPLDILLRKKRSTSPSFP